MSAVTPGTPATTGGKSTVEQHLDTNAGADSPPGEMRTLAAAAQDTTFQTAVIKQQIVKAQKEWEATDH